MKKMGLLAAAAMMAGLWGTHMAMADANHAAAIHRPRVQYATPRRHNTKKGPGRKGAHSKRGERAHRRYCVIHTGAIRTRNKLLGTRG